MKNLLLAFLLLFTFNSYAQELIEYDFDENLTVNIPESSEEGEQGGQKFIRGMIGDHVVVISRSDKAAKLTIKDDNGLLKLYQGYRDGMLKSASGKVISEEIIEIGPVKALNFSFPLQAGNQSKVVTNYIFYWKKNIYTIQFLSPEKQSDNFKATRSTIINSIKTH